MTGIERLRQMAEDFKSVKTAEHCTFIVNTWRGMYIDDAIADIADQIERELREERDRWDEELCEAEVNWNAVAAVCLDMERHVSGVEGADDSPVARWARELREALGGGECDPASDVSMSAYDLLPEEDRDAIAWVREHGGVAEVEKRLMPEGMEWLVEAWPRFEDDVPLKFGDMALIDGEADMVEAVQLWIHGRPVIYGDNGSQQLERGERVQRPTPKVLDADGVEIRVGDTVWATNGHGPFEVTRIVNADRLRVICDDEKNGHLNVYPENITHRAPVLAADGKPLREGEHVYHVETGAELVVKELPKPGAYQAVVVFAPPASHLTSFDPDRLTHERPVSDSWERLEEDATLAPLDYVDKYDIELYDREAGEDEIAAPYAMSRDLVRRAKALAERGA